MWISQKLRQGTAAETSADLGVTTISGENAGVMTRGEVRDLPIYAPTGISWRPRNGDMVLVIKGGTGGQEACVAGAEETDPPEGLGPGELCLHTENASIWVRSDGRVDIWGDLYINGVKYRPFILG